MPSPQGDKKSSDVEMGEATSHVPAPAPSIEAPACVAGFLSFHEKQARRKAEKESVRAAAELPSSSTLAVAQTHGPGVQVPQNVGTQVDTSISCVPDALAQPTGSSTTPILVEDKERAAESMTPPSTRKEVVLALRAPSAALVVQPKGWKRKLAKGNDRESSQLGGLNLAPGLHGKFVSLIDGMISECGSEASRLARDLMEMQGKCSESEAMLKAIEGCHSEKVSKLEVEIGELERDLGKTASSLLKEKKARKAKSSEVRRLQRDKRSSDVEMGEATYQAPAPAPSVEAPACVAGFLSFHEKLARRKAEKESVRAAAELPYSSALAVAQTHEPGVQPTGSSTTPILVEDKERAAESMPPPPARKEVVLALRAPSAAPVVQPKGRKRNLAKGNDGESSQQGELVSFRISNCSLVSQFVLLIDGMIRECGSEASRLARDLTEMQGKCSEMEAMLKAIEGSHSAKVFKLKAEIGELERDLGKTASSLLKEKKARKAKSSEVRRLQRQIESGEESTSRGIEEA
ncbi:hypothetical protein DY000_02006860 [Brassica cretica]|uniref:Uncharacterized protein n=1 Tax=Brassica cretica TaxID=69181 RepID=A0ABQ7BUX1_BRACR|nr:hypothetical protein DY000_02006860 [Brassica cretica]